MPILYGVFSYHHPRTREKYLCSTLVRKKIDIHTYTNIDKIVVIRSLFSNVAAISARPSWFINDKNVVIAAGFSSSGYFHEREREEGKHGIKVKAVPGFRLWMPGKHVKKSSWKWKMLVRWGALCENHTQLQSYLWATNAHRIQGKDGHTSSFKALTSFFYTWWFKISLAKYSNHHLNI